MSAALLEALRAATAFEPQGERVGNLSWGRGTLGGKAMRLALVENRFAGGSIGVAEAERLTALYKVCARERSPLVLYLDSAGAKVSDGLKALGAFRALLRAALEASIAGAPLAAVLGPHCYGGSSLLAHIASRRLFSEQTQLAMSGPAVLAAAAGMSAVDEMFRAMAQAALSAQTRAKASPSNAVAGAQLDVGAWLRSALVPAPDARTRHASLQARLPAQPAARPEGVRRKDLERIYPEGYEAIEADGLIEGTGRRGGREEPFVGLVGRQPVGAARAWRFAEAIWRLAASRPAHVELFLDCASHAARLDDERIVLSEYVAGMSHALAALAAGGTRVGLTILGQAGGGVYAALAAPAMRIACVHGADIQIIPGSAVAAILGSSDDALPTFPDYHAAGVAEEELKLGIVPEAS